MTRPPDDKTAGVRTAEPQGRRTTRTPNVKVADDKTAGDRTWRRPPDSPHEKPREKPHKRGADHTAPLLFLRPAF
jgi:hypothetical protein